MIAQATYPNPNPGRQSRRGLVSTVVADDSPAFLQAVLGLLATQPEIEILGTAADGRQAIEMAARLRPQLVILDFQMPHLNGLAAAREIRRRNPSARIVVMSADITPRLGEISRAFGADTFVEKARLPDELPKLISGWFK